jgi:hypothetical protein
VDSDSKVLSTYSNSLVALTRRLDEKPNPCYADDPSQDEEEVYALLYHGSRRSRRPLYSQGPLSVGRSIREQRRPTTCRKETSSDTPIVSEDDGGDSISRPSNKSIGRKNGWSPFFRQHNSCRKNDQSLITVTNRALLSTPNPKAPSEQ